MFRSKDHPQGATLFLAKVILKTFTKQFHYINRVLWQRIMLCKSMLLGMLLAIARCIPNNILLYNTICCHNTLLI